MHSRRPIQEIQEWSEHAESTALRMRFAWARPAGHGPFPTVLVHPEAWRTAKKMRGILRSFAREGYLAVAVDYRRIPEPGRGKSNFFVWRSQDDAQAALRHVLSNPFADHNRVAVVGYSQGAIYSLLMGAYAKDLSAIVAYYPIGDIESWLNDDDERNWVTRQAFEMIRRKFRKRSGAETDAEYREMLRAGSPLHQAHRISVPVLLIHGDSDTRVDIDESRRIEATLRQHGVKVDLLEIKDGEHVFNFRDAAQAKAAWNQMLAWLSKSL